MPEKSARDHSVGELLDAGWTVILASKTARTVYALEGNWKHPAKWSVAYQDDGSLKSLDVKVKFDAPEEDPTKEASDVDA